MSFKAKILQAIKVAMPQNAEIQIEPGIHEFNVCVSWELNSDPERPSKMSKTILVCISHEASQDFANASCANQVAAFQRVVAFFSTKLAQFDPQHNAPKHEAPPVEKWVINSAVMLG